MYALGIALMENGEQKSEEFSQLGVGGDIGGGYTKS